MNNGRSGAKLTMTLYHVTLQYRNNAPHEYDVRAASPQEAVSRIMWEGWTIGKSRLLADHDNKIPNHVLLRLVVTKKAGTCGICVCVISIRVS